MTTCMMTYPHAPSTHCVLPIDHDGPHVTRSGHGWHDSDDMDGGVTAAAVEQEEYSADDFKRARFATRSDGEFAARVCTGSGYELYPWRCSDIPGRSDRAMTEDDWVPVMEARPLTADDIAELVEQNRFRVSDSIRALYPEEPMSGDRIVKTVTAALTEPPSRPEGAEELGELIGEYLDSTPGVDDKGMADFLVERGVRVVGEERS